VKSVIWMVSRMITI